MASDISTELGVCLQCIRERPAEAVVCAMEAHHRSRAAFELPEVPPTDPRGMPCKVCMHECRIPQNEVGYCGLRRNVAGQIREITAERGKLSWYHDPLPTNCVGDWICAGCTGAGYPQYANCHGSEFGYSNLAVFFLCKNRTSGPFSQEILRPIAPVGIQASVQDALPALRERHLVISIAICQ